MSRRNRSLIFPVVSATDELIARLEEIGFSTRLEQSKASTGSAYVYASRDETIQIKIRVSNHAQHAVTYIRHRKPDFELLIPQGRVAHVVEEIRAHFRALTTK